MVDGDVTAIGRNWWCSKVVADSWMEFIIGLNRNFG